MPTPYLDTIIPNGVNLQPSYYNNGSVNFGWNLMQQFPSIQTVRIEIEPDKVAQAARWIAEASNNGYVVIATYHKHTVLGTDNAGELIAAANWWKANYQTLGTGFVVNLMNEWGSHNISAQDYADAYNQALNIVRDVYDGPVIIDIPGWGQETDTAALAAGGFSPLITDPLIILSVHIYQSSWNSGTGKFLTPSDIDTLVNTGLPCIVGEFGPSGSGDCDWSACVDYAINQGLSVLGWCWNGDGEGNNMVSPSWKNQPTATSFTVHNPYFQTIYEKLGLGGVSIPNV